MHMYVGAWGHLLEVINKLEKKCEKMHENEKMGAEEEIEIGRVPAYVLHSCNSMKLDMVQAFSKISSVYFSLSGRNLSAAKEGVYIYIYLCVRYICICANTYTNICIYTLHVHLNRQIGISNCFKSIVTRDRFPGSVASTL
jgi:hypothetical protein